MMNLFKSLLILTVSASTLSAFAIGLLNIQGKVVAFDESEIRLQDKSTIYIIEKAGLSPEILDDLKKKHANEITHLMVPTSAIRGIKFAAAPSSKSASAAATKTQTTLKK